MNWLKRFDGRARENVPLARMTTFRIGGPARILVSAVNAGELCELQKAAAGEGLPLKPFGRGANLLVSDLGVDAVVVRLAGEELAGIHLEHGNLVVCGGGTPLPKFVHFCVSHGLAGPECLAGIPGTVGAAVKINAGGRFGETGDFVEWVEIVTDAGRLRLNREEAGFGYRSSRLPDGVVSGCGFRLEIADRERLRAAWRWNIERKKKTQPLEARSAGCIFKNPPGDSAGRLIDAVGLKGARSGDSVISERHANFIVNSGEASCHDVEKLVKRIRDTVEDIYGIRLELEVEQWGKSARGD